MICPGAIKTRPGSESFGENPLEGCVTRRSLIRPSGVHPTALLVHSPKDAHRDRTTGPRNPSASGGRAWSLCTQAPGQGRFPDPSFRRESEPRAPAAQHELARPPRRDTAGHAPIGHALWSDHARRRRSPLPAVPGTCSGAGARPLRCPRAPWAHPSAEAPSGQAAAEPSRTREPPQARDERRERLREAGAAGDAERRARPSTLGLAARPEQSEAERRAGWGGAGSWARTPQGTPPPARPSPAALRSELAEPRNLRSEVRPLPQCARSSPGLWALLLSALLPGSPSPFPERVGRRALLP